MPTSLFQYEMLPTSWFYLSSILIIALFFRFNRLASVRNLDVLGLIALTPGLVYVAMGSALQGYLWLFVVGAFIFVRLTLDVFFCRRPILSPNLNFEGLAFSCVASCAFLIPNLFLNRGDACESPRAWRLEQILAASEESRHEETKKTVWPGYPPFLQATQDVNRFFSPSQTAWKRAVTEALIRKQSEDELNLFGFTIRVGSEREKKRPAARAVRWASGASEESFYDLNRSGLEDSQFDSDDYRPQGLNGVEPAASIPTAETTPQATRMGDEETDDVFSRSSGIRTPQIGVEGGRSSNLETEEDLSSERIKAGDSATFRWQPLSQEGLLLVLCVIFLQLGIIATIVLIGHVHFGSLQAGLAAALLYLLHPYINQFTGRLDHIVPALLLLLAILLYRRPFLSGSALGAAGVLVFYPFFLFPLWIGYYWRKGLGRFLTGSSAVILTLSVGLLLYPVEGVSFGESLALTYGWHSIFLADADGIWEYLPRFYRIPIISLFGVFCFGYSLLIQQKTLGSLMSLSAALLLGAQFWMGRQGGLYMAWYLPLIILTIFRPNLSDRTATAAVVDLPGAEGTT